MFILPCGGYFWQNGYLCFKTGKEKIRECNPTHCRLNIFNGGSVVSHVQRSLHWSKETASEMLMLNLHVTLDTIYCCYFLVWCDIMFNIIRIHFWEALVKVQFIICTHLRLKNKPSDILLWFIIYTVGKVFIYAVGCKSHQNILKIWDIKFNLKDPNINK